jgi:hypothetical protein
MVAFLARCQSLIKPNFMVDGGVVRKKEVVANGFVTCVEDYGGVHTPLTAS